MEATITAQVPRPVDRPPGLEQLFREHRLGMVRLAMLLVDDRETAEDVAQEGFAALYRRWDHLDDELAALAYLRTCVVNASRSVLRRRRTVRRHGHRPDDALSAPPADTEVLLAEEHREVIAALHRLPKRQREVIVLRYWSGLTESQIASTLGISVGSVKSNASRGRDSIARSLEASS